MKYSWLTLNNVLNDGHCNRLLKTANKNGFFPAKLGNIENNPDYLDTDIRNCLTSDIPIKQNLWFESTLTTALRQINSYFKFDLHGIMDLQVIQYDVDSYFKIHNDVYPKDTDMQRKITFIMQLSDPDDYTGGELVMHIDSIPDVMTKEKGSLIAFPSYILHEVTPILSGRRYSCIGWCFGPEFK